MLGRSQKIVDAISDRMRCVSVKIGVLACVFAFVVSACFYAHGVVTRIRSMATGITGYVEQLVHVQDLFELSRYMNSLVRAGSFSGYAIRYVGDDKSILTGGDVPAAEARHTNLDLSFDRGQRAVRIANTIPLAVSYRGRPVALSLVADLSLLPPFMVLTVSMAFYFLLANLVRREARRSAKAVARPIQRLAEYVRSFQPEGAAACMPQDSTHEFDEIREVYGQFHDLGTKLAASERMQREQAELAAIGKTTQLIAHDVRKPFSLLKMGLSLIDHETDPVRIQKISRQVSHQVDSALQAVTSLFRDIMAVGAPARLCLQPACPAELLQTTVADSLKLKPAKHLTLEWGLEHQGMVMVDMGRVQRVLDNIFDNALHANDMRGRIWIKTRDLMVEGEKFVEVTIGNSGSFISEERRSRLFKAFYTEGKVNGTGLGLVIAQSIVAAHRGSIFCRSSKDAGTEFVFTLPAAEDRNNHVGDWADDISDSFKYVEKKSDPDASRPLVAVVDDDVFVREAWQKTLSVDAEVRTYKSPTEFLTALETDPDAMEHLHCIVTDFDFRSENDIDGHTFAGLFKSRHGAPIFLASDGIFTDAETLQYDGVISKDPVRLVQLNSMLFSANQVRH